MAKRLWYIITWPSALITAVMASTLLYLQPQWLDLPFMQIKLLLVGVLYGYHFSLHHIFKLLQVGVVKYSSMQLRIWNEVSTLILISVVFLIVKKDQLSWISGVLGIFAVVILLMSGIKLYKYIRTK
jgi:putative membrane protein